MNAPFNPIDPRTAPVPRGPMGPVDAVERGYGGLALDNDGIEQDSSGIFRYVALALKHKLLIGSVLASCIVAGVLVTLLMTPLYMAGTTIQIDRDAAKVVNIQTIQGLTTANDDPQFYQTQYELLRSRALAERVSARLGLADAADFIDPSTASPWNRLTARFFGGATRDPESVAQRQKAAADRILANISIAPVPGSRLVRIGYVDPSPLWAQKIANAIADNFVGMSLDRRFDATAYARTFLEERLQQLKAKLEDSEKQVVAYAQKEGIVSVDDKQSQADSRLAAITVALSAASAERVKAESLWQQAQAANGLGLPQILNDPSVQAARQKRAQLLADYQDKLNVMKPAFPEMLQLKAQIGEVERTIKQQADLIKESIHAQFEATKSQEDMLRQELAEAKDKALDLRNRSIAYNILQREVDTNRSLYDGLLQQYKEIGVAGAVGTNNVFVIDAAELPTVRSSPSLAKNLLVALVLGALSATGIVYLLELLDDTFKTPEELEELFRLPVLGVTPLADQETLAALERHSTSALSEALRSLRTALQFATNEGTPKNILVTSSRPSEGKSTTSLSLARNFAHLGKRVLLVDGDLRNPSLHRSLGAENASGLSTYLAGIAEAKDVIVECKQPNLFFMPSGPLPPNPAELLDNPKMSALLAGAEEFFDLTIIDGPPVMGLADAPILSSIVAGTIVVVEAGSTRKVVVRTALKRLHFARARLLGLVLNKFDARKAGYTYGYGSGYGYAYAYAYDYGRRADRKSLPRGDDTSSAEIGKSDVT